MIPNFEFQTHYSAPPVRNVIADPVASSTIKDKNTAPKRKTFKSSVRISNIIYFFTETAQAATTAPAYSTYDAALYSAASMYVAQQQQAQQKT